jgi:hypothetical protein
MVPQSCRSALSAHIFALAVLLFPLALRATDEACQNPLVEEQEAYRRVLEFFQHLERVDNEIQAENAQAEAAARQAKIEKERSKAQKQGRVWGKANYSHARTLIEQAREIALKVPSRHLRNAAEEEHFSGKALAHIPKYLHSEPATVMSFEAALTLLLLLPESVIASFDVESLVPGTNFLNKVSRKFADFMEGPRDETSVFHNETEFSRSAFRTLVAHFKFLGEFHKRASRYETYVTPMKSDANGLLILAYVQLSLVLSENLKAHTEANAYGLTAPDKAAILESLFYIQAYVNTRADIFTDPVLQKEEQMPFLLESLFGRWLAEWEGQLDAGWLQEFRRKIAPPAKKTLPEDSASSASSISDTPNLSSGVAKTGRVERAYEPEEKAVTPKPKALSGFAKVLDEISRGQKVLDDEVVDAPSVSEDIREVVFKDHRVQRHFDRLETEGNHTQQLIFENIEDWRNLIQEHGWAAAHRLPEYPIDRMLKSERDLARRHRVTVGHSARLIYRVDSETRRIVIERILEKHEYSDL